MFSKWNDFQPSKTLWFWTCAGCAVLTMVLGFTVGGWMTNGTATKMADSARTEGRMQLAADICVAKFKGSDGFAAALANLKKEKSWSRDDFIANGGWVTLAGVDGVVDGAAQLCADRLADMDAPSAALAPTVPVTTKG
jgi:hypothetical protein